MDAYKVKQLKEMLAYEKDLVNGGYGLYPYIDYGCSFQATTTDGSVSTGMCDYMWIDKIEAIGEREVPSLGCLYNWGDAGLWFVHGGYWLDVAGWNFGSRLSLIGRSKG